MQFTLNVVPTAQQRARHTRMGSAYKSQKQQANEHTLEAMLLPFTPAVPLAGPVGLSVRCYFPIPASVSRKKREAMMGDFHTKKPDADNLLKQMLDCMTRLRWWGDDKQVVQVWASKRYSDSPRWEIEVRDLGGNGA